MFGYLRAVFWFAGEEEGGGGCGIARVVWGRGEDMTVPKGAKEEAFKGSGWIVRLGEGITGAIVIVEGGGDGGKVCRG